MAPLGGAGHQDRRCGLMKVPKGEPYFSPERIDSVAKRDGPYQQLVSGARRRLANSPQMDVAGPNDVDFAADLQPQGTVWLDACECTGDIFIAR